MKDDLPGIPAGPRRLEHPLIVFALVVVPDTFATLRATETDHVPAMIAGPAELLDLMISTQRREALLPLAGEDLPLVGAIATDLLHNWRNQHVCRSIHPAWPPSRESIRDQTEPEGVINVQGGPTGGGGIERHLRAPSRRRRHRLARRRERQRGRTHSCLLGLGLKQLDPERAATDRGPSGVARPAAHRPD